MRIAEVVATFPPYHGGMGYVCWNHSRELARRGHHVTVFTLGYGNCGETMDPQGFQIIRLKTPLTSGDAGAVPHLYPKLKPFDVTHLHYPFFGGAEYVYLSAWLRGQPCFLTYHMDVYAENTVKQGIIDTYESLLLKKIIGKATRIGAVNHNHLRSSKASPFIDWNTVIEMPHGVDVQRFSPKKKNPALVEKHGLQDKTVALFVGNLLPFKGLTLLIEAMSKIRTSNLILLIVGGGYHEREYHLMVKERSLENRVIFAGPQSPDEYLPAYFNLGDFLVLPSTHSESFGMVILEAMASGIPAIVSDLPGPSSLIDAGRTGLIFNTGDLEDLTDAVDRLAHNDIVRRQMGHAARQKVLEENNWETIGNTLESTLQEIASPQP